MTVSVTGKVDEVTGCNSRDGDCDRMCGRKRYWQRAVTVTVSESTISVTVTCTYGIKCIDCVLSTHMYVYVSTHVCTQICVDLSCMHVIHTQTHTCVQEYKYV